MLQATPPRALLLPPTAARSAATFGRYTVTGVCVSVCGVIVSQGFGVGIAGRRVLSWAAAHVYTFSWLQHISSWLLHHTPFLNAPLHHCLSFSHVHALSHSSHTHNHTNRSAGVPCVSLNNVTLVLPQQTEIDYQVCLCVVSVCSTCFKAV